MISKHAVVSPHEMIICEANGNGPRLRRVSVGDIRTVVGLCTIAAQYDIGRLWIMPGLHLEEHVEHPWERFPAGDDTRPFISVKNRAMKREWLIGWLDRGAFYWEIDTPITVLATIYYLERELGIPVQWSPGHMGTALVRELNTRANRSDWVRESSLNLFDLPFKKDFPDLTWKCQQDESIWWGQQYLHEFDKNSDYPSACTSVMVGAGDPVHVIGMAVDPSLPGIYRVSTDERPSPTDVLPPVIETEWVTSDLIAHAEEMGHTITIHEGWQFKEKHQTLRSLGEKLWEARTALKLPDAKRFPNGVARENAYETMKQVAVIGLGKLGSEEKTSRFHRPDWWVALIGKARVNKLRNLNRIWRETGLAPLFIYRDGLYFLSRNPNPRMAVPGILDREQELGGYKYVHTWAVDTELALRFKGTEKRNIAEFVTYLRKLQRNGSGAQQ